MVHHLYFHIPFCHRICPYCGFYKHQPGRTSFHSLADALVQELRTRAAEHPVQPKTIYMGGGTPSIFPSELWRTFAQGIRDAVDCSALEEWTVEANPKTFDDAKASAWTETGVTRTSLGVQSFDPQILERLGRDHSPDEAAESVSILRRACMPVVNIDLMFSIPGQTLESWDSTLQAALDLESHHVSAYNLTYEEDTPFLEKFQSGTWSVDSDQDAEFFLLAHEKLGAAGFEHYEVSNYSQPGYRSIHNQAYWSGQDYLGLGPSAVSTIQGQRWKNVCDTAGYVAALENGQPIKTEEETLNQEDRRLEQLGLTLRTEQGLPTLDFPEAAIQQLHKMGLVTIENDRFRLTLQGMMVADEVAGFLA